MVYFLIWNRKSSRLNADATHLNFRLVENVQVIVKTIVSEYLEMEPVGEEPQSISVSANIFFILIIQGFHTISSLLRLTN